jgi:hypothetical protein
MTAPVTVQCGPQVWTVVQYTLVASNAMAPEPTCPDASVVGVPPPMGTLTTLLSSVVQ